MQGLCRIFALSVFLLLPMLAQAFDGNRRGFFLGVGGGLHVSDIDVDLENDFNFGLATSFRIGAGITDKVLLYYINKGSWYRRDDVTFGYGLSGLGASYYFNSGAPAYYLAAGIGYASFDDLDDEESDFLGGGDGTGIMLASGVELRRYLHLEAVVVHSRLDIKDRAVTAVARSYDATTLQVHAIWAFY